MVPSISIFFANGFSWRIKCTRLFNINSIQEKSATNSQICCQRLSTKNLDNLTYHFVILQLLFIFFCEQDSTVLHDIFKKKKKTITVRFFLNVILHFQSVIEVKSVARQHKFVNSRESARIYVVQAYYESKNCFHVLANDTEISRFRLEIDVQIKNNCIWIIIH